MSRELMVAEIGYRITDENSDVGVDHLQGAGAPLGTSGITDDAAIGSIYSDRTNGIQYIKIADTGSATDWVMHGKLSAGYTPASGDLAAGEGIESAIEKLDGNADDLLTAVGVAQGDTDMGTFTGSIITDAQDAKAGMQELSDAIEAIAENNSNDGVTTAVSIDSELVDDVLLAEWDVVISLVDDETQRRSMKVIAMHDGTSGADATNGELNPVVSNKLKFGASFNYDLNVEVSGTGATQVMELKIGSTETNGVNVRCRKVAAVLA